MQKQYILINENGECYHSRTLIALARVAKKSKDSLKRRIGSREVKNGKGGIWVYESEYAKSMKKGNKKYLKNQK